MLQRPCPAFGRFISAAGFGEIVLTDRPQRNCDREVAEAIDHGLFFFDVAPLCGDARERMGPALEPFRDSVVLN